MGPHPAGPSRPHLCGEAGRSSILEEGPYTVQQSRGPASGYTIVPYDPQGAGKGRDPDLIAFHLAVGRGTRVIHIHALGRDGLLLPGSERQVRVAGTPHMTAITFALAFLPILALAVVLIRRRRAYFRE